ncbi:MAG: hypothetical protein LBE36_08150 [Flavobacteriaceae bacterium]|jgi:hypothetical protein|nr:hypothetical protein [Flavobacteriaceae bacterium]
MKKKVLKEVPALKSENGALTGGFSSLLPDQMRKFMGGKIGTNARISCINKSHCDDNTNAQLCVPSVSD